MTRKRDYRTLMAGLLIMLAAATGRAQTPEEILLSVTINDEMSTKATIPRGLEGKALPGGANLEFETKQWAHAKYLLTGKSDQGLVYALTNANAAQWSASCCVIGRNWDVKGTGSDVLIR